MKMNTRLVAAIERKRCELAQLVVKYNYNFQHKAVINKSQQLDQLLNKLNRTF
ncbi:Spo0E like sporulation regulatory protein [compost metagenome]